MWYSIVIGILGLIAAVFAARYARKAWLSPVPDFDLISRSARTVKTHDGKYILHVYLQIRNSSSVSAFIKEIEVNKQKPHGMPQEEISLDEWDVKKIVVNKVQGLPPGSDLPVEYKKSFEVNIIIGSKRPKKAIVKIITPKRTFSYIIRNVVEKSIEDW